MKYDIKDMVQRDHNFCIVDEVDSILIDESRTPLIISGRVEDKSNLYLVANEFVNKLQKSDYDIDEKNKRRFYFGPFASAGSANWTNKNDTENFSLESL